jgi:hypothetical protein
MDVVEYLVVPIPLAVMLCVLRFFALGDLSQCAVRFTSWHSNFIIFSEFRPES